MSNELSLIDVREFVLEQFEKLVNKDPNNLIKFHTINKYLLMAHNPKKLKTLGSIVAKQSQTPIQEVFLNYKNHLKEALEKDATRTSHTNVLFKIYSYFKNNLTKEERIVFLAMIDYYKNEIISLGEILNLIKFYVDKFENGDFLSQTYYLIYSNLEHDSS